jgi:DNA-directed RNA polymerase specialized sigma24 family protein
MSEIATGPWVVPWISPSALLSRAEIGIALNLVTAAEQTALMKIAKHYAKTRIHFDAEDLVHEAIRRVLDGRLAWPNCVPATVFLAGGIRSIAREWMSRTDPPNEEADTGEEKSAERGTLDKIEVMKIMALFDDPITQKIVTAMMDGAKPEELVQLSGLNSIEYEINRKKIRRLIEKLEAKIDE